LKVLECPQCGAPAAPSSRNCDFCKAEFFVTSLAYLGGLDSGGVAKYLVYYKQLVSESPQSAEGLIGLGLCYLHLGTYQLAQRCFGQAVELAPDVAPAYYYLALSTIRGRRLMTLTLVEVRGIEEYLNTASQLSDDLPQAQLLLAMVKRDYYERHGMRASPPGAAELMIGVRQQRISKSELDHLRRAVKVGEESQFYDGVAVL
jgi:tetratricopeptide (TPR) repeat protein